MKFDCSNGAQSLTSAETAEAQSSPDARRTALIVRRIIIGRRKYAVQLARNLPWVSSKTWRPFLQVIMDPRKQDSKVLKTKEWIKWSKSYGVVHQNQYQVND